jgi:uncharacterized membrane protein YkvA (DUF1232 family)
MYPRQRTFTEPDRLPHAARILIPAAVRVLRRKALLVRIIRACVDRLRNDPRSVGRLANDAIRLARLCANWISGQQRSVPWRAATMAVAALLYFLIIPDLIPDVVMPVGLLDDTAVIGAVARSLRRELDRLESPSEKPALRAERETAGGL